jgi:hypothetical protein
MPMNPRLLRPLATGWTPARLGTQVAAWFDADDAATITLNGTGVSQWNDKSGNGRHVSQSNAGAQPTYTTGQLNGRPIVAFDTTDDRLFTTSGGADGVDDTSMFVVMRMNAGGANEDTPVGIGLSGQLRRVRTLYRAINGTALEFEGWGNAATSSLSWDIGGSYHIFGARQAGQAVQLRRDGVAANTTFFQSPLTVNSNNLYLGGLDDGAGGNRRTDGNFAEVLVFYTSINDATTRLVERYLSNKWGIALV